jgi:hypothetical protein
MMLYVGLLESSPSKIKGGKISIPELTESQKEDVFLKSLSENKNKYRFENLSKKKRKQLRGGKK